MWNAGHGDLLVVMNIQSQIINKIGQAFEGRPFEIHVTQPTSAVITLPHCVSTRVYDVGTARMRVELVVKPIFLSDRPHELSPGLFSLNLDSKPLLYMLAILPASELKNTYVLNFPLVADPRKEVDDSSLTLTMPIMEDCPLKFPCPGMKVINPPDVSLSWWWQGVTFVI
jgi:hypothetical protein